MACGGRLKLSDFWLNHKDASLFARPQWPIHQYIYLAYRVFLALYLLGWLVARLAISTDIGAFFVFLTDWTFTVLTFYAVSSCIGAIYFTFVDKNNRFYSVSAASNQAHTTDHDPQSSGSCPSTTEQQSAPPRLEAERRPAEASARLPHYFKLVWLLFNICLAVNPIITVVYWSFLAQPQQSPQAVAMNIHTHALNTVFINVDLLLCAIPVRPVHFVYPSLYGGLYAVFSLIYYWAGGVNPFTGQTAIYPKILDWSNAGWTVLYLVLLCIIVPLVHLAGYGVYRLRVYIYRRYFDIMQAEDGRLLTTAEETPPV